jgi:alpha-1,2-mannosyltransferase
VVGNQGSPTVGGLFNDFFDYWGAARVLDLGGDPYDKHLLGQVLEQAGVHSTLGTGYSYPLLLAELLRPLGLLPPLLAGALFAACGLACLALAVALLLSPLRRASWLELAALATAAGLFAPVRGSLYFGQVNLLLLPLLALAFVQVGRPAALAVASAVKLYPAAAALAFAVEGRRGLRSLAATLAAALALALGPNLLTGRWSYGGSLVAMFGPDPFWSNQSVNGWLSRLLPHGAPVTPLMVLLCAALGALAAAVAARQRRSWPGAYAILLCYSVVAAPKNSLWNFAPLLVVIVFTWSLVRSRPAALALLAAAWALIDGQNAADALRAAIPNAAASAWLSSLPLYGALLLGGVLAFALLLPLRAPDHGRSQRHHADQDEHGGGAPGDPHPCHRGRAARADDQATAQPARHRGHEAQRRDGPEHDPRRRERAGELPGERERHEQRDQEGQLQQRQVAVGVAEDVVAGLGAQAPPRAQRHQGGGAAEAGEQEQAAQRVRVAPDRLVGDAEQDPGVAADEQGEHGADHVHHAAELPAEHPRDEPAQRVRVAPVERDDLEERQRRERAERHQAPGAERHR